MNKKQLVVAWVIIMCLCPLIASAVTFDEMLMHRASNSQPFWGYQYKNIRWNKHEPLLYNGEQPEPGEADYRGQIDIGNVDLDGDGMNETIKVIWGTGVSDNSLTIEVYKESKKIATLQPKGIQPNFKVEDLDGDGKLEIVLWGTVDDPKMSQLLSDESKPFEGHSSLHLFKVSIYKLGQGKYKLSKEYTSKKKYEPFCKEQPKE